MSILGLLGLIAAAEARAVDCRPMHTPAASYVVCRVDVGRERLRLEYADARGVRFESFDALRANLVASGQTLKFAMNAGMFHPDFKPVGLLVIDGQEIAPLNRRQGAGNFFIRPNGVFMLDERGARVISTDDYRDEAAAMATQSGPMLVHGGQTPDVPAFHSKSRHVRNGVCAQSSRVVAFVISDAPVTFQEFASFFRAWLGCSEALYLDGSISSLYAPALNRADSHAKLGPLFSVAE